MATVSGKLESIQNQTDELGSLVIALCGYGAQLPRVPTTCLLARVTEPIEVALDSAGFTVQLPGNDTIEPPGTYYTVTVKDSNGDAVQINAYVFLDGNSYSLVAAQPFDPALPMMPLPPLIVNQLLVLTSSDAMVFDGTNFTAFESV